jgi:hypothetical protein
VAWRRKSRPGRILLIRPSRVLRLERPAGAGRLSWDSSPAGRRGSGPAGLGCGGPAGWRRPARGEEERPSRVAGHRPSRVLEGGRGARGRRPSRDAWRGAGWRPRQGAGPAGFPYAGPALREAAAMPARVCMLRPKLELIRPGLNIPAQGSCNPTWALIIRPSYCSLASQYPAYIK